MVSIIRHGDTRRGATFEDNAGFSIGGSIARAAVTSKALPSVGGTISRTRRALNPCLPCREINEVAGRAPEPYMDAPDREISSMSFVQEGDPAIDIPISVACH